ncbi:hypothetical protein IFR04_009780 [Cadophora malorum]|uniref:Mid2 domain-containing protein n=1 Tax=Cadophora malorum TaxID=108018 RepID=A0A8H7WA21_9HELO|nr:hypothetical protein IFR04_009780 [Cadophora malorum]
MAQSLIFETPSKSVRATIPVNITWNPQTFGAGSGSFALSLWLLRSDSPGNEIINSYLPQVLARMSSSVYLRRVVADFFQENQSVFDNIVVWTPTLDDVTVDVPQLGSDQLAWEKTNDNPELSPFLTKFKGFSRGFTVQRPVADSSSSSSSLPSSSALSSSSSSLSISSPTSSATTTPAPTPAVGVESSASNSTASSTNNLPIILGLSIGLGLLLLIGIGAAFWGVRRYRRLKATASSHQPQKAYMSPGPSIHHKWELGGSGCLKL